VASAAVGKSGGEEGPRCGSVQESLAHRHKALGSIHSTAK
jgi:hypothetical protein